MGFPVAGSGFSASILSRKVRGIAAKNIGVLSMVICCLLPSDSLNSKAMPRGLFSVSAAFGFPPASEKRATTGMVDPENSAERE